MSILLDLIEFLIDQPNAFASMKTEIKIEVSSKRPVPDLGPVIGHNAKYKFEPSWYDTYPWLTGSLQRKRLYCYHCLLFGGDYTWTSEGISQFKNFVRLANKHEISKKHIVSTEKFVLLHRGGATQKVANRLDRSERILKLNFIRKALQALIKLVCSFSAAGVSTVSKRPPNFLELLRVASVGDYNVTCALTSELIDVSSTTFQHAVIESIKEALFEKIRGEIFESDFVTVRIIETLGSSFKPQLAFVFRYFLGFEIIERYMGLIEISAVSPFVPEASNYLAGLIEKFIDPWLIDEKIIAFSFNTGQYFNDCGPELHEYLKRTYQKSIFIHGFEQNLNYLLLLRCRNISRMTEFIGNIQFVNEFFAGCPERFKKFKEMAVLKDELALPWKDCPHYIRIFKSCYNEIMWVCKTVVESPSTWDLETCSKSALILHMLNSKIFVYLVCLFDKIFSDNLNLSAQEEGQFYKGLTNHIKAVDRAINSVKALMVEETVFDCEMECNSFFPHIHMSDDEDVKVRSISMEILESIERELRFRFRDYRELIFCDLLNETMYERFNEVFPTPKFLKLLELYPVFVCEQLQNELVVLYSQEEKRAPVHDLVHSFMSTGLDSVYSLFLKLYRLVMTFPLTGSLPGVCSKIDSVEIFLQKAKQDKFLETMDIVFLENHLLTELMIQDCFFDKILETSLIRLGRPDLLPKLE